MAKEFSRAFYDGREWKRCRASYIANRRAIDGGLCEQCRDQLGYMVHHKKKLTPSNINNVDITLNHCNLEYVCKHCHDREEGHFLFKKEKPVRCVFDGNGNPIPKITSASP